jgi:hypothetical protein
MLANAKRRYLLGTYTVEKSAKGWAFCPMGHEKDKVAWSKPYGSVASVTLMIARRLRKEVERRDAPFSLD